MSLKKFRLFIFGLIALVGAPSVISCNSKNDEPESDIAVTPAVVAVKNFSINRNDSVMAHLDSVFFSIDLNSGVIFNADSLPVGTDVSRLVPNIIFLNSMSKAELTFLKDNEEEVTVNYLENSADSIDFSYPVALNVTALDGVNEYVYQIKVNVHKVQPDSLVWNRMATSQLPSRFPNPKAQKTVIQNDIVYTIVEENNGDLTLATSSSLNADNPWTKQPYSPAFTLRIETLTASPDQFFVLSDSGELLYSEDLFSWTSASVIWSNIIGVYGDSVLGLKENAGNYYHTQYPLSSNFMESMIDSAFPIDGFSPMGVVETKWAPSATAFLMGGITAGGQISSYVWAFDGYNWAVINDNVLPALNNPMMTHYVVYRKTTTLFTQREFDVWLLFGGTLDDNQMNREVYISYNNGVNWSLAPDMMQLSDKVPNLSDADAIVADYSLSFDLSQAWTPTPDTKSMSDYVIEGTTVTWMCPYLYIFGGYNSDGDLNPYIYRGVLQRLAFTPKL